MKSILELMRENFNETFKSVAVYRTDYEQFDKFISICTGQEFEIVVDQELGNDTSWTYKPITATTIFDENSVEEFLMSGNHYYLADSLMDWLLAKGWIFPGEYIVDVSY